MSDGEEQHPEQGPSIDEVTFDDLIDLAEHRADTYIGIAPRYHFPWIFGGQVIAQALRAAQHTVEPEYPVHSLHAYFIRGGTSREPIRFEVDRIRNGRSFRTRRVVARQSGGAILNLSASFQRPEEGADVQAVSAPADAGSPSDGDDTSWAGRLLERRTVSSAPARQLTWARLGSGAEPDPTLGSDPGRAQCGLAFVSDAMLTGSVRSSHPLQLGRDEARRRFATASLDHVVYFHRPADPNQWLLAEARCHSLVGSRGVAVVDVFDGDGVHVATVVQEVLLRVRTRRSER